MIFPHSLLYLRVMNKARRGICSNQVDPGDHCLQCYVIVIQSPKTFLGRWEGEAFSREFPDLQFLWDAFQICSFCGMLDVDAFPEAFVTDQPQPS